MHTTVALLLANDRIDHLRRDADRARLARHARTGLGPARPGHASARPSPGTAATDLSARHIVGQRVESL
jgi:hypothetical protein